MPTLLPPEAPLFLDLDGVLLDVRERHYRVHCDVLAATGGVRGSPETYWRLRRAHLPLVELLAATAASPPDEASYRREFLARIEAAEYLFHDRLVPGASERLAALASAHPLALVTLRRHRDRLLAQLEAVGMRGVFAAVHSASGAGSGDWDIKRGLIAASPLFRSDGVVVGDTEADVRAGKALGLRTVAVLTGLRSRELLAAEAPDALLDTIAQLE